MNKNEVKKEYFTVWSFPKRGDWATHNPKYRGNYAPQIARNILKRYTKEGDTVLDPMVGGGTTLIEAKLLNRKGIGFDINPNAVEITKKNLEFDGGKYEQKVNIGDTRNIDGVKNESIDLIMTHPPYLNIIKYSDGKIPGDLSNITGVQKFLTEFQKAINEYFRVLKENHYCVILIGDTRKSRHYVPLAYYIMELFLKSGFILKEDIIKIQHNCQATPYWKSQIEKYNFYLIAHEHLFVFRKPKKNENLSNVRYSYIKQ